MESLVSFSALKRQLAHGIIQRFNKLATAKWTCILQWILAHADIDGNDKADILTKKKPRQSSTFRQSHAIANHILLRSTPTLTQIVIILSPQP